MTLVIFSVMVHVVVQMVQVVLGQVVQVVQVVLCEKIYRQAETDEGRKQIWTRSLSISRF